MPLFLLVAFLILMGSFGVKKIFENRDRIIQEIRNEANRQGVDSSLALAIAQQESGFSSIPALDFVSTGSWGIYQLEPGTASDMAGQKIVPIIDFQGSQGELLDIRLGVQYIAWLQNQLDDRDAVIQAFNEGIGNYRKGKKDPAYLARVSKFYNRFSEESV